MFMAFVLKRLHASAYSEYQSRSQLRSYTISSILKMHFANPNVPTLQVDPLFGPSNAWKANVPRLFRFLARFHLHVLHSFS
jgi:hypothetical protein